MPRETYIPCLFQLFRQHGYDGVTLAKISAATGLGKASLYHHFPGGKEEMVDAVLDYVGQGLEQNVLPALTRAGTPIVRLQRMCDQLSALYAAGQQPCIFASLQTCAAKGIFHDKVKRLLRTWMAAITAVLVEAGMDATQARQRGEDAVIAIQGALILAQALDDPMPFQRVIRQLPQQLCQPHQA